MDITWLGHSSFMVKGKEVVLVTDPHDGSLGATAPSQLRANVVTISNQHPHHSHLERVAAGARVVRTPGEYEIAGIFVIALKTQQDPTGPVPSNMASLVEIDDIRVCHLGDIDHVLSHQEAEQLRELGDLEVLLLPVGGDCTINAKMAAEVVRLLAPRVVVPMHYRSEGMPGLQMVDDFLKEMGQKEIVPQRKLQITRASLPEETRVVLLECAG